MSTAEDESKADEDPHRLRREFEQWLLEAINDSAEKGYRTGYYNGFVAGFPTGFREAVRDQSVPIMRTGWDQVPDEVIETGNEYCQVVMTVLHMAKKPGWT